MGLFHSCYLLSQGKAGIVELLLKNKANIEDSRNDGATALTIACQTSNASIVKILLAHGADPNATTFFHCAF